MGKLILFVNIMTIFTINLLGQEFKNTYYFKDQSPVKVFVSKSNNYFVFNWGSNSTASISKSTDNGLNWINVYNDNKNYGTSIGTDILCFEVKDSILVLGLQGSGKLKKSYDEGKTWIEKSLPFTQAQEKGTYGIKACKMVNSRVGYAMTYVDLILTEDGWDTFKKIDIPDSMTYFGSHAITFGGITVPDENSIFIAGSDISKRYLDTVYLISSLDKGKTWKMTITNSNIFDLNSYGNRFVVSQGFDGDGWHQTKNTHSKLSYTSDRGETWIKLVDTAFFQYGDRSIKNISFIDKNHFVMSLFEYLFITSDAAITWQIIKIPDTNGKINDIKYLNKDSIILIGDNGNFYKCYPNAKSNVDDNQTTINNISYYPNPTKDKLNIRLDCEPIANEEIEIYDLMGQNIITQKIENTNTNVNLQELNTGIY